MCYPKKYCFIFNAKVVTCAYRQIMTAVARAKANPLTRSEATEILNSMPYLVATSSSKLLPEMFNEKTIKYFKSKNQQWRFERKPIIEVEFTVFNGARSYTFEKQPFQVLCQITREEFLRVLPSAAAGRHLFFYRVGTD